MTYLIPIGTGTEDADFLSTIPSFEFPDITTGLLLDYNADSLGAIGSDVTSWNSAGGSLGSAANLTVVSTSRPNVVAGPGGHKAVQAVGASSEYLRTALFGSPVTLPLTQAVVMRKDVLSGTQSILSGDYSSSVAKFIGMDVTATAWRAGAGATGEISSTQSGTDTAKFHVIIVRHGASARLSVDGHTLGGVTGQASPTLANMPRVGLFTNSAATGAFASASIARVLMFSRSLTDVDIASLDATLRTQYGID